MCNVIHLLFTCKHVVELRRSQCKGTRYKTTQTSIRAACTAEPLLTLNLQTDCSSCVYQTWENDWTAKLARATTFLAKLQEKCLPGVDEISALVQELDTKYRTASWDTRHMVSHTHEKSVARVSVTDQTTARSPLMHEVRPEDIAETKGEKKWSDTDEHDYDGNYIASTDPLHPVNTDYTTPWADDDGTWLAHHLSPEELASSPPQNKDVALDLHHDQQHWSWDAPDEAKLSHEAHHDIDPARQTTDDATATARTPGLENQITQQQRQDEIQQVIHAFWDVVNTSSSSSSSSNNTVDPTTSSSSSSNTTTTTPNPTRTRTRTRTHFDKQRSHLVAQQREHGAAEHTAFYRDWLRLARREVRAFEGLDGRHVPDPPMSGFGGCGRGSGWFK
ncbi:hypothetical protein PTTW11_07430 [Pyrenophora teres f. teres]|uniref:Uncharacterized protein n=1 Tax=Pyrenophora teres f. teres TaxID=97479 RepID=A0A6S6W6S3_9PLEO|nr:hypothetical protein PTTW11_07430 [Pyrenophora teres f. teres]